MIRKPTVCLHNFLARYFGWYSDPGRTDLIPLQMLNELRLWRDVRKRPVMVAEYGADAVAGKTGKATTSSLANIYFKKVFVISSSYTQHKD